MDPIKISNNLLDNYRDSYQNISESRDINAVGKVENIIKLCSHLGLHKVLEIGCGEGAILQQLSLKGFGEKLFGLEIASSGVEITNKRGIKNLVECSLFDGYHTNFYNNEFDLVILSHVMEHVEHPRLLLYEAKRISHNIFIEVPLEDNLRLKNNFKFTTVGHINYFSYKTMRLLLQTCDLRISNSLITNQTLISKKYSSGFKGVIINRIKALLLFLSPVLASKLFTYHYCLLCKSFD